MRILHGVAGHSRCKVSGVRLSVASDSTTVILLLHVGELPRDC